ncbi:MAG: BON domain-containing protein [Pseudomonadales bacterium]
MNSSTQDRTQILLRGAAIIFLTLIFSACSSLISATRSGPIQEDYGKRSFGSFIDDGLIETKTRVNLKKANEQLKQAHVGVTSYNGVVLLAGQVPSAELRDLAGNVAGKVRNVKRVHNELEVAGPISLPARSNDSWLTTKVKSKLIASSAVKGRRIKVVTENGVVHLMGLVTRNEADKVVNVVKGTFGVQKIVRIFEYID